MWAIYAFLSAFFVATTDPIAKRALGASDEYVVGWLSLVVSSFFLSFFWFFSKAPPLNAELLKTLLLIIPIEILATVLYYRALRLTDISLSVPFLALTPVFTIVTAFLLLGEKTRPIGAAGIAMITIGVYSLNLKEARYGPMSPIRAILLNRGSLYMVLVALLFSITSTVSKRAMLLSSPESIPFIYNLSIALAMAPIIMYRLKNGRSRLNRSYKAMILFAAMGFFSALSSIFYFKSVSMAGVAYAISIKRMSLLMSVGYGWIFFRERDIHIRLFSAFCMFLGVILILICG
ncbi:MAG: DMT family transporter [Candidatus Omnitrophota bacterium]|nr:DMT family transporter [Candidatus Omnitrophota bacterium]